MLLSLAERGALTVVSTEEIDNTFLEM